MSPKDLQLTFVVKIQCQARVSPELMSNLAADFPESQYQKRHGVVWYMAQMISERGIPVCGHLFTTSPVGEDINFTKLWNFDLRSESKDIQGNVVFDFDLRSRVLTFNDLDYKSIRHVPGALEEVGHVVRVLNTCQVPFSVNANCGLHVYVGLKRKHEGSIFGPGGTSAEPFNLTMLQALSGIVTAAEPCINSMLAEHRRHSDHHKTPSATAKLSNLDAPRRIKLIERAASVLELVELMNPDSGKNYAYNFAHILRGGRGKRRDGDFASGMIEFRQHEGTLNSLEIIDWLLCVAGIVRLALGSGALSRAKNWTWQWQAEQGEFTLMSFLEEIGKGHLAKFYSQKAKSLDVKEEDNHSYGLRKPQSFERLRADLSSFRAQAVQPRATRKRQSPEESSRLRADCASVKDFAVQPYGTKGPEESVQNFVVRPRERKKPQSHEADQKSKKLQSRGASQKSRKPRPQEDSQKSPLRRTSIKDFAKQPREIHEPQPSEDSSESTIELSLPIDDKVMGQTVKSLLHIREPEGQKKSKRSTIELSLPVDDRVMGQAIKSLLYDARSGGAQKSGSSTDPKSRRARVDSSTKKTEESSGHRRDRPARESRR